jgi:hypothetical protein
MAQYIIGILWIIILTSTHNMMYAQEFYSLCSQAVCVLKKHWESPPTEPSPNKVAGINQD